MTVTNRVNIIDDLKSARFTPALSYDQDNIAQAMRESLAEKRRLVQDQIKMLVGATTANASLWGGSGAIDFAEQDPDFPQPLAAAENVGYTCGYPIKFYAAKTAFTKSFWAFASGADIFEKTVGMEVGYEDLLMGLIQDALFASGSSTATDPRTKQTATVRPLLCGDGVVPAPWGNSTFSGTHNHLGYLASGSVVTESDLNTLISNIEEHGHRGVTLFINAAQKSEFLALTHFVQTQNVKVVGASDADQTVTKIDYANIEPTDFLFGDYLGHSVYVKNALVPANYVLAVALSETNPVLKMREWPEAQLQGLMIDPINTDSAMVIKQAETWVGFGCNNLSAGAILYTGGSTVYVAP